MDNVTYKCPKEECDSKIFIIRHNAHGEVYTCATCRFSWMPATFDDIFATAFHEEEYNPADYPRELR